MKRVCVLFFFLVLISFGFRFQETDLLPRKFGTKGPRCVRFLSLAQIVLKMTIQHDPKRSDVAIQIGIG